MKYDYLWGLKNNEKIEVLINEWVFNVLYHSVFGRELIAREEIGGYDRFTDDYDLIITTVLQ